MFVFALWACQEPTPTPIVPYRDTSEHTALVDTATLPLGLQLSAVDQPPVAADTELELVMVWGPAGGWDLQIDAHLSGLARDPSTMRWIGLAELPDGATAQATLNLLADEADGSGVLRDIRHYLDIGRNSPEAHEAVCTYAGQTVELRVDLEDLDDGRATTLIQPVVLRLDPVDEPNCE